RLSREVSAALIGLPPYSRGLPTMSPQFILWPLAKHNCGHRFAVTWMVIVYLELNCYENDSPESSLSSATDERAGPPPSSTENCGKIRLHQHRGQQWRQRVKCFRKRTLLSVHCSGSAD